MKNMHNFRGKNGFQKSGGMSFWEIHTPELEFGTINSSLVSRELNGV